MLLLPQYFFITSKMAFCALGTLLSRRRRRLHTCNEAMKHPKCRCKKEMNGSYWEESLRERYCARFTTQLAVKEPPDLQSLSRSELCSIGGKYHNVQTCPTTRIIPTKSVLVHGLMAPDAASLSDSHSAYCCGISSCPLKSEVFPQHTNLCLSPAVLLLPSVTPRLSRNLAICCRNLLVDVNNKSLNFTESW